MDYMQQPEELKKHPEAFVCLQELASGDQNVLAFLWAFFNFTQCFDDMLDGDYKVENKELAMKALHDFTTALLINPFVLSYAPQIHTMWVQTMNRCLDGDEMEQQKNPLAAAVRCGDVDFISHMAYLAKGWTALREAKKHRKYDK